MDIYSVWLKYFSYPLWWSRNPLPFTRLSPKDEGTSVGEPIEIVYVRLKMLDQKDPRDFVIRQELTKLVLFRLQNVNAYRILWSEKKKKEGYFGRVTIQPCLVED